MCACAFVHLCVLRACVCACACTCACACACARACVCVCVCVYVCVCKCYMCEYIIMSSVRVCVYEYYIFHVLFQMLYINFLVTSLPSQSIPLFGTDLATLAARDGQSVPLVVTKCISEVDRRGLTVPGIYRVGGSARRKEMLRKQLETSVQAVDLSSSSAVTDVNDVAGKMLALLL